MIQRKIKVRAKYGNTFFLVCVPSRVRRQKIRTQTGFNFFLTWSIQSRYKFQIAVKSVTNFNPMTPTTLKKKVDVRYLLLKSSVKHFCKTQYSNLVTVWVTGEQNNLMWGSRNTSEILHFLFCGVFCRAKYYWVLSPHPQNN